MSRGRSLLGVLVAIGVAGCGHDEGPGGPPPPPRVGIVGGQDQAGSPGDTLPIAITVAVRDAAGDPAAGVPVRWAVTRGTGSLTDDSTLTDTLGEARTNWALGPEVGGQLVAATVAGIPDTAEAHATARGTMTVVAGGNNVPERYSSDLWVAGSYAYTGTWGGFARGTTFGNVLKVWDVSTGATLVDSVVFAGSRTISDDEVSADGTLLLATTEGGTGRGLYLYSLADPAHPSLLGFEGVGPGLHTGTFADIGGARYVFAAEDPPTTTLRIFRIQPDSTDPIVPVAAVGQPADYGIHDQYLRDGLAFVSDWDSGGRIYDVGNGLRGGTPARPVLVSQFLTATDGAGCRCVHNMWWYHDAAGRTRYLFVGQEAPGVVGSSSSGDIHVIDVHDLAHPVEVAHYHLAGAGTHNFWMDEPRGILYAAYYNGGVVALDVTGTLTGDLASREIARIRPGGDGSTYAWGVMLANGSLWVTDMLSGFWELTVP